MGLGGGYEGWHVHRCTIAATTIQKAVYFYLALGVLKRSNPVYPGLQRPSGALGARLYENVWELRFWLRVGDRSLRTTAKPPPSVSRQSLFRFSAAVMWAARWQLTKHSRVGPNCSVATRPPLLPWLPKNSFHIILDVYASYSYIMGP